MIACVLVPYFTAAVECRAQPALAGLPLVFVERGREDGAIVAVSQEAARSAVRPGMPLRQAQFLCPHAETLTVDPLRDRAALDELAETLSTFSERVEPGLWREDSGGRRRAEHERYPLLEHQRGAAWCLLDLGMLRGEALIELAQEIGLAVREQTRLAPSLGIATGVFAAQLAATLVEPGQALIIPPRTEAAFLAPLSLRPVVLEPELARRLRLLGITTFGQLADLPEAAVLSQLGAQGALLHQLSRGIDLRQVRYRASRPMERVRRVLDGPLDNRVVLAQLLQQMAGELTARVQARGYAVRTLSLALSLEDGTTHELRLTLAQPVSRQDLLRGACAGLLEQARIGCGVEEVVLTAPDLAPATGRQLDLFAHGAGQARRLHSVLHDLVARHGTCFYRILLADPAARLPERRVSIREVGGE